jgi:hypothetical protein
MSSFLRVKLRFALACSDRQIAKAADAINRLVTVNSVKELQGISDLVAFRSVKTLGMKQLTKTNVPL